MDGGSAWRYRYAAGSGFVEEELHADVVAGVVSGAVADDGPAVKAGLGLMHRDGQLLAYLERIVVQHAEPLQAEVQARTHFMLVDPGFVGDPQLDGSGKRPTGR